MPSRTAVSASTAAALLFAQLAHANPTAPAVAAGSATFQASGRTLTVTNAPGTIINWQSFSIGAGEITRFQQQSSLSAVLNRVTGGDPSSILGTLSSNGRVFLINPNGLLFGAGSVIDTAGFVASTLNIADRDFLAGRLKFEGGGAGVLRNEGTIRASGDIYLVGPRVENAGIIRSEGGGVALAAGQSVTITGPDAQGIQFALQAPTDTALNLGRIEASTAAGLFAGTLRHSGEIRAVSASAEPGGRIVLAAQKDAFVEGTAVLSADSAQGRGGSIQVTGERVGLFDTASLSARGATGGGQILVGGDYQGGNPGVRNAWRTYVAPQASLDASATANGDGGRVIVWADDITRYFGRAAAEGGPLGGNGGLVEVSGKNLLTFSGAASLAAPAGLPGRLLLDPRDITVQAGAGTLDGFLSVPADPLLAFGDPDNVTDGTLNNAVLGAFTSGQVELQSNRNITFNAPVTMQSGVTLKAAATNNVNVNANITTSGGGQLILEADTDNGFGGTVNLGGVTLNAPVRIGGCLAACSSPATLTGNVVFGGDTQVNGLLTVPPGMVLSIAPGKTLTINSGMALQSNAGAWSTVAGGGTVANVAGSTITYTSPTSMGTILGGTTLNNAGTLDLQGGAGGGFAINDGAIFNNLAGGTVKFTGTSNTLFTSSGAGTFNNSGSLLANGSGVRFTNSGLTLNLNNGGVLDTGASAGLIASSNVNYAGTLTMTGAFTLGGGTHTVADGAVINGTGALTVDGAAVTLGNVTLNKALVITPGDIIAVSGGKTLTVNNGLTLQNGAGAWSRVNGGGTLANSSGSTITYTSTDSFGPILGGLTLNNSGTFDLQGGNNGSVSINDGSVFNNLAGGTVKFTGTNNAFQTSSGTGTFNNAGTLLGNGSGVRFTNSGLTLNLNNGGVLDTGASAGLLASNSVNYAGTLTMTGAFTLGGGTHAVADGAVINGTGALTQAGAGMAMGNATLNKAYVVGGGNQLNVNPGKTLTVNGGVTMQNGPGSWSVIGGGGTLANSAGSTLTYTSTSNQGSIIGGVTFNNAGTVDLQGPLAGGGIAINDGAVFNNLAGGTVKFTGTSNRIETSSGVGSFSNAGTIDVTAANGSIDLGFAHTAGNINVGAGRTLTIAGTGLDWKGGTLSGTGTYNLAGGFAITGGGARILNGPTFNLNNFTLPGGSLDVQGGTLNLAGTTTVSAGTTLAATGGSIAAGTTNVAGTLQAGAGALTVTTATIQAGGTLKGAGTVTGNVVNNGTVAPGTSPGTLVVNGNYTQGAGGTLNVELGGSTQGVNYDLLQVTGTATLDGTLNVSHVSAFSPAVGNTFDPITYANRVGDFATRTFPALFTYSATPNPATYRLAVTAAPVVAGSFPVVASQAVLDTPANEVKVLEEDQAKILARQQKAEAAPTEEGFGKCE